MTEREYTSARNKIDREYYRGEKELRETTKEKKAALREKYIAELKANAHKFGEIVSDGLVSIEITQVSVDELCYVPRLYYFGRMLKKNGKPYADGRKRMVESNNII